MKRNKHNQQSQIRPFMYCGSNEAMRRVHHYLIWVSKTELITFSDPRQGDPSSDGFCWSGTIDEFELNFKAA